MQFPWKPPTKQIGATFHPKLYSDFLYRQGWRFTWQQGAPCPCAETADDDSGRKGCPVCGGVGWYWHSAQETRAVVTRARKVLDPYTHHGEWGNGEVNLSLHPHQLPAYKDRFRALDAVFLMQELRVRGPGVLDSLRYPVAQRVLDLETGDITLGVTECRKTGLDGFAEAVPLLEGIDFAVDAEGRIDWTLGIGLDTAPVVGGRYGIVYTAHPMFEALEDGYSARDARIRSKTPTPTWATMLMQVRCKLKHGKARAA